MLAVAVPAGRVFPIRRRYPVVVDSYVVVVVRFRFAGSTLVLAAMPNQGLVP